MYYCANCNREVIIIITPDCECTVLVLAGSDSESDHAQSF
jgi:hypothetical protein